MDAKVGHTHIVPEPAHVVPYLGAVRLAPQVDKDRSEKSYLRPRCLFYFSTVPLA